MSEHRIIWLVVLVVALTAGAVFVVDAQTTNVERDFNFSGTSNVTNVGGLSIGTTTVNTGSITFGDGTVFTSSDAAAAGGEWTSTSTGIFYNGGRVGIGTNSPNNILHATGPIYGTIFYDHDNNTYYVNPSGTSNFGGNLAFNNGADITTVGAVQFNNTEGDLSSNGAISFDQSEGMMMYTDYTAGNRQNASSGHFLILDTGNITAGTNLSITNLNSRTAPVDFSVDDAFVINSGSDTMAGTLTANQLTDRNNTSYYVNPSGTSNLSRWRVEDSGGGNSYAFFRNTGGSANSILFWEDSGGGNDFYIGQLNENDKLRIYNYAAGAAAMEFNTSGVVDIQSGNLNMSSNRIINVASPTNDSDAATKSYVDSAAGGGVPGGSDGQTLYNSAGSWVASTSIYVASSTGNVGIGTNSPAEKLSVKVGGNSWSDPHFAIEDSGTTNKWGFIYGGDDGLYIGRNESSQFVIESNGSVGIGDTTADAKLDVNGDVTIDGSIGSGLKFTTNGETSSDQMFTARGSTNWIYLRNWADNAYRDLAIGDLHVAGGIQGGGSYVTFNDNPAASTYYDKDNTSYYVNPGTSGVSALVNGSFEHVGNVRHYQNLATYNGGNDETGTMKIDMPKSWSNTMMQIRIQGYQYRSNTGAWEVVIGGYNYTGASGWNNYSAEVRGDAPFSKVRLIHDGDSNAVLLGNTGTLWDYPKVVVSEFVAGHSNQSGWGSGWSISVTTNESGFTATTTPAIETYLAENGNFGIGDTSPSDKLEVAGTVRANQLTDRNNTSYYVNPSGGSRMSQLRYASGDGLLIDETDGDADTWLPYTNGRIYLTSNGDIGAAGLRYRNYTDAGGYTTQFDITAGGAITAYGNLNMQSNDITNVDKIDANTVDPVYNIGDTKYATYMAGMTGVKEETTGLAKLKCQKRSGPDCRQTVDFDEVEEGSDLWLFYRTSDLGKEWEKLRVVVTARHKGGVWNAGYDFDPEANELRLTAEPVEVRGPVGELSPEVSYRLTAPRFDADEWSNRYQGESEGMTVPAE